MSDRNSQLEQDSNVVKKAWHAPEFQQASISSETMAGGSTSGDGGGGYS